MVSYFIMASTFEEKRNICTVLLIVLCTTVAVQILPSCPASYEYSQNSLGGQHRLRRVIVEVEGADIGAKNNSLSEDIKQVWLAIEISYFLLFD
jgi:hypothetical protein